MSASIRPRPLDERPPHPRITLPMVDVYTCSHCGFRLGKQDTIVVEWYDARAVGVYHSGCALAVHGAR